MRHDARTPGGEVKALSSTWLIAIALVFAGYTALLGSFNWHRGVERAVLILLALPICVLLLRQHRRPRVVLTPGRRGRALLLAGCGVLLTVQLVYLARHRADARLVDIATTTISAGDALLAGRNPYSEPVDPRPESGLPGLWLDGYKYGPLMALLYLPLGSMLGAWGIRLTNLALDLAVAAAAFGLSRRLAGGAAAALAMLLYLAIPFLPSELFLKGVTDLAAVLPLLVAFLVLERRPLLAGVLVGASISTKLVPGVLVAIACLPPVGRGRYLGGVALGLVPLGVAAALSPSPVVSNLLLYNLVRPPDSTSWLEGMPIVVGQLARLLLLGGMVFASVRLWRRPPELYARIVLAVVSVLGVLLTASVCHRNYLLWWLPFAAVLVASALVRDGPSAMHPVERGAPGFP